MLLDESRTLTALRKQSNRYATPRMPIRGTIANSKQNTISDFSKGKYLSMSSKCGLCTETIPENLPDYEHSF